MTIGDKIKRIRNFRGLTQKELGIALGFPETNADVRTAQYESGTRTPKMELLSEIAKVLDVSILNFHVEVIGCAEDIMQTFFWLDEASPSAVNLFQMAKNPKPENDNNSVLYNDDDNYPVHSPVGIWFKYGLVNDFMKEWLIRKEELRANKITRDEYFEWKLNWPYTCDSCGKFVPKKAWRKPQ